MNFLWLKKNLNNKLIDYFIRQFDIKSLDLILLYESWIRFFE